MKKKIFMLSFVLNSEPIITNKKYIESEKIKAKQHHPLCYVNIHNAMFCMVTLHKIEIIRNFISQTNYFDNQS